MTFNPLNTDRQMRPITLALACALSIAIPAAADTATLAGFHIQPMTSVESQDVAAETTTRAIAPERSRYTANRVQVMDAVARPFAVYPVAGIPGRDFTVPFWVDLDPTSGLQDWKCSHQTYDGHNGEDQYIHSFREQEIGVPVFAALDGYVLDAHDGEADDNTSTEAGKSNYVIISHLNGQVSEYVHLKKDSIPVVKDQFVTAGTQIGLIGSSGPSVAPHLHFGASLNDQYYEPMAGPCRAGASGFNPPPVFENDPVVLGIVMSDRAFDSEPAQALHDPPHTGTFVTGPRKMYVSAIVGNVPANTNYTVTVVMPGGERVPIVTQSFGDRELTFSNLMWTIDTTFSQSGTGQVEIKIADKTVTMPYRVVSTSSQKTNRAPSAIQASLEPLAMRAGDVAVCKVDNPLVADPDYDSVTYHYVWRSGDTVVRDVNSAVRTDALARQFVVRNVDLSCTVTVSDGTLQTQPAVAHALPVGTKRRRAVGH